MQRIDSLSESTLPSPDCPLCKNVRTIFSHCEISCKEEKLQYEISSPQLLEV